MTEWVQPAHKRMSESAAETDCNYETRKGNKGLRQYFWDCRVVGRLWIQFLVVRWHAGTFLKGHTCLSWEWFGLQWWQSLTEVVSICDGIACVMFLSTETWKITFLEAGLLFGRLDVVLNRVHKIMVISSLISLLTLC